VDPDRAWLVTRAVELLRERQRLQFRIASRAESGPWRS
jgi:hypothetical protein